jgi:7-carboxy-7-deazaguanine synthase (Cx14CxxC type)
MSFPSRSYAVKEIFYTLQGEGVNAGRPAVFCRFSGCNLWSGREADRERAVCQFCDTDFVGTDGDGGGKFASADELADAIAQRWPAADDAHRFVVCTGGEPLLQLDAALIDALHQRHFVIAIETNGTIPVPPGVDWICVSPKAGAPLAVTSGDELKVVYPQAHDPSEFLKLNFRNFFLQPMDGPDSRATLAAATQFCLDHPSWRLSLQTHKLIGIR